MSAPHLRTACTALAMILCALPVAAAGSAPPPHPLAASDWRNIDNGPPILKHGYADQPYVVIADDGAWVCVVTTGAGHEGQPGQHVCALRSTDQGRTWSKPVPLESPQDPESSYVVAVKLPGGRIVAFYNYNADNVRAVKCDPKFSKGGLCKRVDTLGHFVYRWSDDHGVTWSKQRAEIPQRVMAIDRANRDGGTLLYFWTVGRGFLHQGHVYVPLHKVGNFGIGFIESSEGVLLHSADLATAADPAKATWETLPDGDIGLRTPAGGGPVAEEQSFVPLSDGTFYCVYRTIDGFPSMARSRDRGRTWTPPAYQRYADGRPMKHPRAANFAWPCGDGRYLYWFHNHGGKPLGRRKDAASYAYQWRNPAWISAGVEVDAPEGGKTIHWSQPEILLWHHDPKVRMSYPDLVIDQGAFFITETQKTVARVHPIDPGLLALLWAQTTSTTIAKDGLVLEADAAALAAGIALPAFPASGAGLALDCRIRLDRLDAGQVLLDARDGQGLGLLLHVPRPGVVELALKDAKRSAAWDTDAGMLKAGAMHSLTVSLDAAPNVISFVVDGRFNDGGDQRQFGWGRCEQGIPDLPPAAKPTVGSGLRHLRVYSRPLRTSEAIASWRAVGQ